MARRARRLYDGRMSQSTDIGLHERVRTVLDRIRPAVQADGGDIEFVDIDDAGLVRVRMHGACVGCPSSDMTLRLGIERSLKEYVPEISGVETVD